ncbi:hypothetical protein ACQPZG_00630 (plasmid) [Streptomyces sp. CA-294286]
MLGRTGAGVYDKVRIGSNTRFVLAYHPTTARTASPASLRRRGRLRCLW